MYQNLKKWLVIQIKPNSHGLACINLERQGYETFGPKMRITIKKENKFINKDVLVFPGYIFVGVDQESSNWTKINSTYGVSKVLIFNKKPCEISNSLIIELKNRYETNAMTAINENLKKGDNIKFNSGPFVNFIARIENMDEKNRIWLVLEAMGTNKKLKIEQTELTNLTKV